MNRLRPSVSSIGPMQLVRFVMIWLVAIAALALSIRNGREVIGALAVTRVDNLEVTGTTDATGEVTARAGVRLTTPTTGPIFVSGTGIPSLSATKGSLYLRTDTAGLYQNTDGATTWAAVGSGGGGGSAPTISTPAFSTPPASVNLSTLGDLDWYRMDYAQGQVTEVALVRSSSQPNTRYKLLGGVPGYALVNTLHGVRGATQPQFNSAAIAGTTFTTTASDDSTGTAASSTTYAVNFTSGTTIPVNFGWDFAIPMRSNIAQQVVRVYFSASGSTDIAVSATGSISGVTASGTQTASVAQSVYLATFTITGGYTGEVFRVRILATTNPTGNISNCLAAITIGTL